MSGPVQAVRESAVKSMSRTGTTKSAAPRASLRTRGRWPAFVVSILALIAPMPTAAGEPIPKTTPGAVFAMTNAASNNEVVMYARDSDGLLTLLGRYPTGGWGSGGVIDPLASQNALILSRSNRLLFAVNAGSDDVSVFGVRREGLRLLDRVGSGGGFPVSLTWSRNRLYVLNAGGDGNITGFSVGIQGRLVPIEGSTRAFALGGTNPPDTGATPAQVQFTPDGDALVVVFKEQDQVRVFPLRPDGLPAAEPVTSPSAGGYPFGFTFDRRGNLLVSEVVPNAVSSYAVRDDGSLELLTRSLRNFQRDTCWIDDVYGVFAYVTNTSSHNVTGYLIREDGTLELLDEDGLTLQFPSSAAFPSDLAVTRGNRFLYTLNGGTGTIGMVRIELDGSLSLLGEVDGLPRFAGVQGIAAF